MRALILIFILLSSCTTTEKVDTNPYKRNLPPYHLVLGLDGVGFSTFKKMYDGGYFRYFKPPVPMLASFPTLSDPNWARMFTAPVSESYTKAYFDPNHENENDSNGAPIGSLMNHLTVPPDYEKGFDFKAEGFLQHLALMTWTQTSALYWLDALEKNFFETKDRAFYFAFIMNTDIISHVAGEKYLMEYLAETDKRIQKLRKKIKDEYGFDLQVTIVSDHGNYFTKPKSLDFENHLKDRGWNLTLELKNDDDVAIVLPEIIAIGAFYLEEEDKKAKFARDISSLKGVHFSTWSDDEDEVLVRGDSGQSLLRYAIDEDERTVTFEILEGKDFLGELKYFKKNKGTLKWDDYFNQSINGDYPYAGVRIWEGFYKNSRTAASVLVSPELGYVFSNSTLNMLTALKGLTSTHGSLHKSESLGVLASTLEPYLPIRPEEFQKLLPLGEYRTNLKKHGIEPVSE